MTFANIATLMMRKPAAAGKSDFQVEAETHSPHALLIGDTETVSGTTITTNVSAVTGPDGLDAFESVGGAVIETITMDTSPVDDYSMALVFRYDTLPISQDTELAMVDGAGGNEDKGGLYITTDGSVSGRVDNRSHGGLSWLNTPTTGVWGFCYVECDAGVGVRTWVWNQDTAAYETGSRDRTSFTGGGTDLNINTGAAGEVSIAAVAVFDGFLSSTDRDALLDTVPTCK